MAAVSKLILALILIFSVEAVAVDIPTSQRAERAIDSVEERLKESLSKQNLKYGSPIFIRIFKNPGVLEVWIEADNGEFKKFKSYDICKYSGELGPKLKEGDNQSPEGFYFVTPTRLNPWSQYHLSFNLGFPNAYDRHHGRTGSALMVHGDCVSIGCYAMTDPQINEIYALAAAALKSGQPFFRVHSFPFELDTDKLSALKDNKWYSFWLNLKTGYDHFNQFKRPPNVEVTNGKYVFTQE